MQKGLYREWGAILFEWISQYQVIRVGWDQVISNSLLLGAVVNWLGGRESNHVIYWTVFYFIQLTTYLYTWCLIKKGKFTPLTLVCAHRFKIYDKTQNIYNGVNIRWIEICIKEDFELNIHLWVWHQTTNLKLVFIQNIHQYVLIIKFKFISEISRNIPIDLCRSIVSND